MEAKLKENERICPQCGSKVIHKHKYYKNYHDKQKKVCGSCRSKNQMANPSTRSKRIESLKKVKHTSEWHNKISLSRKENGTNRVSDVQREKLRISLIDRKIQDGVFVWPNYNKSACEIFSQLESDLGWDGFFATKNQEWRIGKYWVDYYEPNLNVVIEFDESSHYKNGVLREKDVIRQNYITDKTGCKFHRIREGTNYGEVKNIISGNL